MDKTVVVLIGAGVCCVVIGLALFVKLLTTKNDDSDEACLKNGKSIAEIMLSGIKIR